MFPWYAAEVEMKKASRPQDHRPQLCCFSTWGDQKGVTIESGNYDNCTRFLLGFAECFSKLSHLKMPLGSVQVTADGHARGFGFPPRWEQLQLPEGGCHIHPPPAIIPTPGGSSHAGGRLFVVYFSRSLSRSAAHPPCVSLGAPGRPADGLAGNLQPPGEDNRPFLQGARALTGTH